jgi:hypothetical protein
MKEQKPLRPDSGEPDRFRTSSAGDPDGQAGQPPPERRSAEVTALKPGLAMQNEVHPHKTRGRLGRDVQSRLGKTLQAYFDDVVKEGVPDRFKNLLDQFDERKDKGPNG